MTFRLSRRTVLRGLGGIGVGLPVLECMLDSHGEALAQSGALPLRYAVVFAGQAIGGDSWAEDRSMVAGERITETGHFIVPPETGTGYTVTTPLEPLRELGLLDDFTLVSGLAIPFNANSVEPGDVPEGGAFRDFHGGGSGPLLCGTRSLAASYRCRSATSDQLVAQANPGSVLDSLVVRAQPAWYLSGSSFSGRQYISYRGEEDPVEAQVSPLIVYRSLFEGFTPSDGEAAAHDFALRARRSVLSVITDKRERLLAKVGAADRIRLERHFDEIRDLETRITSMPPATSGCARPAEPGEDPATGENNAGSGSDSIATNTGYSDEDGRARALADLIHMAFVCDLTRVATLQITVFQSHMNVYPITEALGLPVRADLHECGHNGDQENRGQLPVSTTLKWHIKHYAYLLDKLKNTPEGAGNVLDNSAVIFMPEAGHGVQLNDGVSVDQTHSVEKMVLLVAGRAGGLAPRGHLAATGTHPAKVLVSAMQAAGYEGDSLGEVTGNVPELFG
ncbi:MAG TPA: DUF1552 domain-containing protein [Polyangiaceae bacterium]